MLPERTPEAEDAFVAEWARSDDVEALIEAVGDAVDARRPRLAARLVGLLPDRVEIEPGSALERASRAARLLLVDVSSPVHFNALDEAWASFRKTRVKRMKTRMREAMKREPQRVSRFGRKARKR